VGPQIHKSGTVRCRGLGPCTTHRHLPQVEPYLPARPTASTPLTMVGPSVVGVAVACVLWTSHIANDNLWARLLKLLSFTAMPSFPSSPPAGSAVFLNIPSAECLQWLEPAYLAYVMRVSAIAKNALWQSLFNRDASNNTLQLQAATEAACPCLRIKFLSLLLPTSVK